MYKLLISLLSFLLAGQALAALPTVIETNGKDTLNQIASRLYPDDRKARDTFREVLRAQYGEQLQDGNRPLPAGMKLAVPAVNAKSAKGIVAAETEQPTQAGLKGAAETAVKSPTEDVSRRQNWDFKALGSAQPITVHGVDGSASVGFGLRLDEVVTAAHLTLRFDYSPALLPTLSHIKVFLNEEIVGTVVIPQPYKAGQQVAELDIDPRYFSDYNNLRFQLIGHYTNDCEDPTHSSLWATISNLSKLQLTLKPLPPADDLALLPAPFFDRHDSRRLELPMVMAAQPDLATLRAAGVVASWFGALASYRGARFPVALGTLPKGNAILFLKADAAFPLLADWLAQHPISHPALAVIENPADKEGKLLLIMGRDDAQLKLAADALVLGQPSLSGSYATVTAVKYGNPRQPYDAPNWIPTYRPVRMGELVDTPGQLQVNGHISPPVRVNLRLPPDLFPWRNRGVPLDLKYRYTPPPFADNSTLSVGLNEQFVQAFRLRPQGDSASRSIVLPILEDGSAGIRDTLTIPAFRLGGENQLQFEFRLDLHRKNACESAALDNVRAALDPDSSIDLSDFPHFTTLPNLAFFANSAYPFSRYADLAQTAVVIAEKPDARHIETLLFIMGRMGAKIGYPSIRYRLVTESQLNTVADADLIYLAKNGKNATLSSWGQSLPALIEGSRKLSASPYRLLNGFIDTDRLLKPDVLPAAGETDLETNGPLAAIVGFESPLQHGRSVVALSASSPEAMRLAENALENPGLIDKVRGHAALIRGEQIQSFDINATYDVGTLPWWMRVWVVLSRHPLLLAIMGLMSGLVLGSSAFVALKRVAARRLGVKGKS